MKMINRLSDIFRENLFNQNWIKIFKEFKEYCIN